MDLKIPHHPLIIIEGTNAKALEITKKMFANEQLTLSNLTIVSSTVPIQEFVEHLNNLELNPMIGEFKIILITEFEKANKTKSNALLKIIDENNTNNIVVLQTLDSSLMIPTILSRAIVYKYDFDHLTDSQQQIENALLTKDFTKILESFKQSNDLGQDLFIIANQLKSKQLDYSKLNELIVEIMQNNRDLISLTIKYLMEEK